MRIDVSDMSLANAAQLATVGIEAIRGGDTAFDLSSVRTCDSSALVVLLAWQREAESTGRSIVLDGVPADMLSLAAVYGVVDVLPLGDSGRVVASDH